MDEAGCVHDHDDPLMPLTALKADKARDDAVVVAKRKPRGLRGCARRGVSSKQWWCWLRQVAVVVRVLLFTVLVIARV